MTIKDLTKLQGEMHFLAGLKCFDCEGRGYHQWHDGFGFVGAKQPCSKCNGSSLKREYDCLRLEFINNPVGVKEQRLIIERMEYLATFPEIEGSNDGAIEREELRCWEESCAGYITLPAERAHEAVGKLLLVIQTTLMYESRGSWAMFKFVDKKEETWHDTPEEAIIPALCEKEKLCLLKQ